MLALKTALGAKLDVQPQTISRMMDFFAAHYIDGRTIYFQTDGPPMQLPDGSTLTTPAQVGTDAMTGVGMMAVEFFEHNLDSPIVQVSAARLAKKAEALSPPPPDAVGVHERLRDVDGMPASTDYYLWYNCTMAMFQVGGEPWKRWNGAIRDRVIALQIQGEACDRGSWSPERCAYGTYAGRIYTTALAVLTLEVYYRFQRVADQPEKEDFFEK
jgi:hypothetical protein